jgi:hypothetical protein
MAKDPSTEQTAAGLSTTRGLALEAAPGAREVEVLRALAARVAELAARPIEAQKRRLWTDHNMLKATRPLIFCDPENGWNEIIRQSDLVCEKPLLRVWEMALRKEIFWGERMGDDRVIEPFFNVPYAYEDSGWGIAAVQHRSGDNGSYTWDAPLKDYAADIPRLRFPEIRIDQEATASALSLARELFSERLAVRLRGIWWWTLGMTWDFITLRGLEAFMMDMYDNPDGIHATMAFLRDGTLKKLEYLEREGLLALNTEGSYVGSGGFGFTEELPAPGFDPARVRTTDMWGFAESQETVGVSTSMFEEFVFPYQLPILERFGLNCYGCCEPIDPRWEAVRRIPRLRRVSCSPWANYRKMADYLGGDYVLSMKPSPTPLARPFLDETEVRASLRRALDETQSCRVEIIMKDNHTLGGNPENATRWCRIAREEAERQRQ